MNYHTLLAIGVVVPLVFFAVLALFGHRIGKPRAGYVAFAGIALSCVLSTWVLIGWHGSSGEERSVMTQAAEDAAFTWAEFGSLEIKAYVKLDSLTVIMYFMVTFVSSCIFFFSIGYMEGHSDEVAGESKYHRFFAYLCLFCFSMLGLVIASSLLFLFIFWELVGLCSYLLIGFYFDKKFASDAGMKAFNVADAEEMNPEGDEGDHEEHDHRQAVEVDADGDRHRSEHRPPDGLAPGRHSIGGVHTKPLDEHDRCQDATGSDGTGGYPPRQRLAQPRAVQGEEEKAHQRDRHARHQHDFQIRHSVDSAPNH